MELEHTPEHRIRGEKVSFILSPNHSGIFKDGLPDTIIVHYTALEDIKTAVSYLTDPERKISAHLLIGREGEVVQLVPFNYIAWHAGESKWKNRSSINKYSIGIEFENVGYLKQKNGLFFSWFGKEYPENQIFENNNAGENCHRFWHSYSRQQIDAFIKICKLLKSNYPIKEILGHSDISPGRKVDPGPAFPMEEVRRKVLSS